MRGSSLDSTGARCRNRGTLAHHSTLCACGKPVYVRGLCAYHYKVLNERLWKLAANEHRENSKVAIPKPSDAKELTKMTWELFQSKLVANWAKYGQWSSTEHPLRQAELIRTWK